MKLVQYPNYDAYKNIQINGYREKEDVVWVSGEEIKQTIVPYIHELNPGAKFGLCHGTRNGKEQQAFIDGFKDGFDKDVHVLGTEIAPEAAVKFPNTIEWDFHVVKEEWLGAVDFIYTNAFDHSYKPEECLAAWMSCLSENGICIIEWTEFHGEKAVTAMDPFGASDEEYTQIFEEKYNVVDTITKQDVDSSCTFGSQTRTHFFIKN